MIVGAILQTASISYAMLVVARVITGLGNGLNVRDSCHGTVDTVTHIFAQTSTVPSYHAECVPAAQRGASIMIEGSLITFGIMLS